MPDPHRRKRTAIIFALLGVAIVAGVSSILLYGPARTPVPAAESTGDGSTGDTATPGDALGTGTAATSPRETTAGDAEGATEALIDSTERVPAIVVSARTDDGVVYLEVDYIQFLTGDEAAAAASARGDESPPPNDYYIVNDNARLRRFAVQDDISVDVVVQDDGTSDPGGRTLPLADWVTRLQGPSAAAFASGFYWLTVSGETITTIEQQYLP